MELCGDSLKDIIRVVPKEFDRKPGAPIGAVEYYIWCQILQEILECVQYLHELSPQIIHRDLKPDNIMIARTVKNGRIIKLCDFGLASVHTGPGDNHGQGVGTIKYMAPEVKLNSNYSTNADIYSIGVIAHELFDLSMYE